MLTEDLSQKMEQWENSLHRKAVQRASPYPCNCKQDIYTTRNKYAHKDVLPMKTQLAMNPLAHRLLERALHLFISISSLEGRLTSYHIEY